MVVGGKMGRKDFRLKLPGTSRKMAAISRIPLVNSQGNWAEEY